MALDVAGFGLSAAGRAESVARRTIDTVALRDAKSALMSWASFTTDRRMTLPMTRLVLWNELAATSATGVSAWRTMSLVTREPRGMSTAAKTTGLAPAPF